MQAGSLRSVVVIMRQVAGVDDWGQALPDAWAPLATVRANVRNQSGKEAINANAETSTVKTSIRIRFREDITAGMRVQHGQKTYDIQAVLPDDVRRVYVDLVCEVSQ